MKSIIIEQAKYTNIKEKKVKINLSYIYQDLQAYYTKYRTRQQLISLTDEQLNDIGLSKAQALIESRQPFWK